MRRNLCLTHPRVSTTRYFDFVQSRVAHSTPTATARSPPTRSTLRKTQGRKEPGLQPAIIDRRFQDRVGAELFELLHDADHFAAADHDADGAPGGVFQRVDRGTAEAGGDLFRFSQLGAG